MCACVRAYFYMHTLSLPFTQPHTHASTHEITHTFTSRTYGVQENQDQVNVVCQPADGVLGATQGVGGRGLGIASETGGRPRTSILLDQQAGRQAGRRAGRQAGRRAGRQAAVVQCPRGGAPSPHLHWERVLHVSVHEAGAVHKVNAREGPLQAGGHLREQVGLGRELFFFGGGREGSGKGSGEGSSVRRSRQQGPLFSRRKCTHVWQGQTRHVLLRR
jgi:hypothetical protein